MISSKERLFNAWVQEHYRFLLRGAWGLTGSRETAEELVQDAFEIAWRQQDQLRRKDSVRAWLFQILRHEALRHLSSTPSMVSWDEEHDQLQQVQPDGLDLRLDLIAALQRLSVAHRDILVLFYLQDLDYREMASALEIPAGTVMSRLARARGELQKLLEGAK